MTQMYEDAYPLWVPEEEDEWIGEVKERRHMQQLVRHPDCRDPEHPGCTRCRGTEEEDKP